MPGLVYGMLSDERVATLLLRLHQLIADQWVCVVRSIDSIRSPEDLGYCLSAHGLSARTVQGNVCITGATLRKAVRSDVLTGFDEVWVFLETPPAECLDVVPSATSETTDFGQDIPKELRRAMERTQAILVLGDGCGLNYATTHDEIAQRITSNVA